MNALNAVKMDEAEPAGPFAGVLEPKLVADASHAPNGVLELRGAVQHYSWGDTRFIPALIGAENPAGKPFAELWMGAHPDGPAKVVMADRVVSLDYLIQRNPEPLLHPAVAARFGGKLPFLFKVLAASSPLSVQVHPDRARAADGFAKENAAGIKLNAAARNYRDANHKPELIVALTDFYALRGFRPVEEIIRLLEAAPELRKIAWGGLPGAGFRRGLYSAWTAVQTAIAHRRPGAAALRQLYATWIALPQATVDRALDSLVRRVEKSRWDRPYTKSDWEYWLLRARDQFSRGGSHDRGLISFLLLNLVHLRPGEGLYLPAGVLHAYLEGAGVELMANSNNVLRGGLTSKHVDVEELLLNVNTDAVPLEILQPQRRADRPEWVYAAPAEEFQLARIELDDGVVYHGGTDHAVEIFLAMSAPARQASVQTADGGMGFGRGRAFLVPANADYQLHSPGPATLFKATVPLPESPVLEIYDDPETPTFRGRGPAELAFGTSGLRGLVAEITDLEAYINTRGFLECALERGDAAPGQEVSIAGDLRPSSNGPDRSIVRAVARAVVDSGLRVDYLGHLPTPALTYHALQHKRPSIMVTGSHIPFDRNGIKFNFSTGEVLKRDEADILRAVKTTRRREYSRSATESLFADDGMFKPGASRPLPETNSQASLEYLSRYLDFLPMDALQGRRVVFYQHSAVGWDLLMVLLVSLGAEVIPMGKSEVFVPVDTEAVSDGMLRYLQGLADHARQQHGPVDAIVSTDGDSDRPLFLAVTPEGEVRFCSGDLLGLIAADFLGADTVAVPISANDAVDRWAAANNVSLIKTRIGSPHVIEAMQQARAAGAHRVVGWEANGGFLVATDIVQKNGRVLKALPTRDAALPLLAPLCAANERGISLTTLFAELPHRAGKAGLIDQFPTTASRALLRRFSPPAPDIEEVIFSGQFVSLRRLNGAFEAPTSAVGAQYEASRQELERFFARENGFDRVTRLNALDGLRIWFANGDIAHIRPSGNAPQLRIYAAADTQARADEIVALALREPDGILRRMEAAVNSAAGDEYPLTGSPMVAPLVASQPAPPDFVEGIRQNIALTEQLFARGETPEVIATVSGSGAAKEFWQTILDRARGSFRADTAISLVEDLPTNQAFGLLLMWQRLKPHLRGSRGALAAFVFGDGTRSTPFTETDGAQKPAMATFVTEGGGDRPRFLSMVELALRQFVPVQQFLRRSGFRGLVVKWGDEVQIPTRPLSGADPLFHDADIVRFVSMRNMNDDEAKNKDWLGVDERGAITAFIPRRPLDQMAALARRGLLQRRGGQLWGGINLGSIAVSDALLDVLLEEFKSDVNDPGARREHRPALDPEFFTALTLAAIEDGRKCAEMAEQATAESSEVRALFQSFPDLLARLRRVLRALEKRQGRKFKMVAMDFGDQYWGDIGQHAKIYDFYMALRDDGPAGQVARALAGLPARPDARGNYIVNSEISPGVRVSQSVLINAVLTGRGVVERGVLLGTRAGNVEIREGFDVLSAVTDLHVEPRGGAYKVVAGQPVHAGVRERLTTLFLPSLGPRLFRVQEDTDLKNKAAHYAAPILGNPLSFHQAHTEMAAVAAPVLEKWRREAEDTVLHLLNNNPTPLSK